MTPPGMSVISGEWSKAYRGNVTAITPGDLPITVWPSGPAMTQMSRY